MLPRALAFSIFVHLLFLFQGPPITLPVLNQSAANTVTLTASLVKRLPVPMPPVPTGEPGVRKSTLLLPSKVTPNSSVVFPLLAQSTAAIKFLPDSSRQKSAELDNPTASPVFPVVESKDVASSASLGAYRLSLAREARRFKQYPPQARENLWEGRVLLMLHVSASAGWPVVSLEGTSGYAVLDAQAMEMMVSAARLVTVPDELRGKAFAISLPIHYRLDD